MKLKQVIHCISANTRRITCALGTLAMVSAVNVYAAMPVVAPPSAGAPTVATNWLEWLRAYGKDAFLIVALLIMAYGLVQVAGKVFSMYGQLSSGKVTWGEIGGAAVGGSGMLLFGLVLITAGAAVL